MARLTWSLKAAEGLERIHAYISEHNPGAAKNVARAIAKRIKMLQRFPRMGSLWRTEGDVEIREIYHGAICISYRTDLMDNIQVIEIIHGSTRSD